jgi:hypothetical protein
MKKVWAQDQVARYSEAARHMRDVAMIEGDLQIAERYREIAERYEHLTEQTRALADDHA